MTDNLVLTFRCPTLPESLVGRGVTLDLARADLARQCRTRVEEVEGILAKGIQVPDYVTAAVAAMRTFAQGVLNTAPPSGKQQKQKR